MKNSVSQNHKDSDTVNVTFL